MKIFKLATKVGKKRYVRYMASLTKREAETMLKFGDEFELKDMDRYGEAIFQPKSETNIDFCYQDPIVTTVRIYMSREEYRDVMRMLREDHLTLCRFFNMQLRGYYERKKRAKEVRAVRVAEFWLGTPRSRKEKLLFHVVEDS